MKFSLIIKKVIKEMVDIYKYAAKDENTAVGQVAAPRIN